MNGAVPLSEGLGRAESNTGVGSSDAGNPALHVLPKDGVVDMFISTVKQRVPWSV